MKIKKYLGWLLGPAFSLAFLPMAAHALPGEYTCYLADSAHDNSVKTASLLPPLSQKWNAAIAGINSSPIVADGTLFVTFANGDTNNKQAVEALQVATGKRLWGPLMVPTQLAGASLAYENGRLFVLTSDSYLQAYSAATGELIWNVTVPGKPIYNFPETATAGKVFVGGSSIDAFNEGNGKIVWSYGSEDMVGRDSSIAVADGLAFGSYGGGEVYAVNASSGAFVWKLASFIAGGGGFAPVYVNGRVYTEGYLGHTSAGIGLDAKTGIVLSALQALDPTPAANGLLYERIGPALQAVVPETQQITWTALLTPSPNGIEPLVVNGNVYTVDTSGKCTVYDGKDGAILGAVQVGGSTQGYQFVVAAEGKLIYSDSSAGVAAYAP